MKVVGLMWLGMIMGWLGIDRSERNHVRNGGEAIRGVGLHGGSPGSISGGCDGYIEGGGVQSGD